MGSVGDAYDNAMCESFFATLETELIERKSFRNQAEARMAVFDFIEAWYNPHRRHSALGQMSPLNYEKEYANAALISSPKPSTAWGQLQFLSMFGTRLEGFGAV